MAERRRDLAHQRILVGGKPRRQRRLCAAQLLIGGLQGAGAHQGLGGLQGIACPRRARGVAPQMLVRLSAQDVMTMSDRARGGGGAHGLRAWVQRRYAACETEAYEAYGE